MQTRTLVVLLVLGVLALFTTLNWEAFVAPTTLWLVFWTVKAPLGLIMLGFVALLTSLFLAFVLYLQGSSLLEMRRHAKELQVQRELADKAEASRFSELRAFLESRIDKLDHDFGAALERNEASMAAYVGELDARLQPPDAPGRPERSGSA